MFSFNLSYFLVFIVLYYLLSWSSFNYCCKSKNTSLTVLLLSLRIHKCNKTWDMYKPCEIVWFGIIKTYVCFYLPVQLQAETGEVHSLQWPSYSSLTLRLIRYSAPGRASVIVYWRSLISCTCTDTYRPLEQKQPRIPSIGTLMKHLLE